MNRPKPSASPEPRSIAYTQAVPIQILEAIITAREALDPYYPSITWPQWHQAFRDVQPRLRLDVDRATATFQGLTELTHYFEARYPSVAPTLLPASPLFQPEHTAPPSEPLLDSRHRIKKTYSMRPDLLESLSRVSFWRRVGKSDLINLAVEQLMATYSESQIPLPLTEV